MGFAEILSEHSGPLGRFAAVEELGSILAIKEMREIQEDQTTHVFTALILPSSGAQPSSSYK